MVGLEPQGRWAEHGQEPWGWLEGLGSALVPGPRAVTSDWPLPPREQSEVGEQASERLSLPSRHTSSPPRKSQTHAGERTAPRAHESNPTHPQSVLQQKRIL